MSAHNSENSDYPNAVDYLGLLNRFPRYLLAGWHPIDRRRGHFGEPSHGEAGMRTMGNVVFTAALLAADPDYDDTAASCDRDRLLGLARQGLAYMTDGHKTGGGHCADGLPWGEAWQSAWWTSRMAAGARLIWTELDSQERAAVERVVAHEADCHLQRIVPSGLAEDTKAEENAWDAEILATACTLLPNHPHSGAWRTKLIEFAANTLSIARDRYSETPLDGAPIRELVYTVNLHDDFTLENHGAYHFCYVASPLQSIAWSLHAFVTAEKSPPDALFHHVDDLWARVKPTFLDCRFAYVGGQDWARYTYGEYFIVPALVMLQWRLADPDARAIETARLRTLAEEQAENRDGSFFGQRFTAGCYYGQPAKYETDCYANLGLAYRLHRLLAPEVQPSVTGAPRPSAVHVSPESGIAFSHSPRLFASFSWRTLTTPFPQALFIPSGRDDLAEWQPCNLLGRVLLVEPLSAVSIRGMRETAGGFVVEGAIMYRGRKGLPALEQRIKYRVDATNGCAWVESRVMALRRLFVRRVQGLCMAVPNDRFNGFIRSYAHTGGETRVVFDPTKRGRPTDSRSPPARVLHRLYQEFGGGKQCLEFPGSWITIDDSLGIVDRSSHPRGFRLHCPRGRNLSDGSLHYDMLVAPDHILYRRVEAGDVLLDSRFDLIVGDAAATLKVSEERNAR